MSMLQNFVLTKFILTCKATAVRKLRGAHFLLCHVWRRFCFNCHKKWWSHLIVDNDQIDRKIAPHLLSLCGLIGGLIEELLQRASLPTLYTRRLQDIAIMMFKVIKNGLVPPYITDLFVVSSTHYNLRNSDFIIPRFKTVAYGKHSLSYLGPVLWSKLEKPIRLPDSLESFKKRIKQVNFNSLLDIECKDCFLCNN